uniref:Putative secreted protein n=1 Tax=Anopheles darlingi TaxID=43151 RepID=A0A2M4D032_ANODA
MITMIFTFFLAGSGAVAAATAAATPCSPWINALLVSSSGRNLPAPDASGSAASERPLFGEYERALVRTPFSASLSPGSPRAADFGESPCSFVPAATVAPGDPGALRFSTDSRTLSSSPGA